MHTQSTPPTNGCQVHLRPRRRVRSFKDLLRRRLDTLRAISDILAAELPWLQRARADRLTHAAWLLRRAGRLTARAWRTLEGR
jgi:hypothetical protein